MKNSSMIIMPAFLCGILVLFAYGPAIGAQFFGDNVGIISGTVEKGDSERGLTVRSTPSSSGAPMAFLPFGTKVQGSTTFKNGYVKIEVPVKGGWVPMDFLSPTGGEAVVARVDKPDLCLRIRSGPSVTHEQVGCAEMGQKMELTGLWSTNGWAQVSGPTAGWVTAGQINSEIKPLGTVGSTGVSKPSSRSDVTDYGWSEPATKSTEPQRTYDDVYPRYRSWGWGGTPFWYGGQKHHKGKH